MEQWPNKLSGVYRYSDLDLVVLDDHERKEEELLRVILSQRNMISYGRGCGQTDRMVMYYAPRRAFTEYRPTYFGTTLELFSTKRNKKCPSTG